MKQRFANSDQAKRENLLNRTIGSKIGFVFALGTALAGTLTGCIGYDDRPRGGGAYVEPSPVYVESGVVARPEYVYYPGYGGRLRSY